MHTDTTRQHVLPGTVATGYDPSIAGAPDQTQAYERTVDVVLDDLFLSVGQAIGLRATVDYDAVLWLRTHFRQKFLAALHRQGDRWLDDRAVVTAVSGLFAERAVRYANGAASIALDDVRQAAADVERYCRAHARRAAARAGASDAATALIAGYWCTWDPEP
jgi:hypothetical protein